MTEGSTIERPLAPRNEAPAGRVAGRTAPGGVTRTGRGAVRTRITVLVLAAVFVATVAASITLAGTGFPTAIQLPLGNWTEALFDWFTRTGTWLYEPVADAIRGAYDGLLGLFLAISSPAIAVVLVAIVFCAAGWRVALLTAVTLVWVIAVGLWDATLETIAFMTIAVVASSAIGLVIGIVASANKRLDSIIRVVLDAMQAYPSFAYLVPVVVVFGAGDTAALIVTIIWATPPIARMTAVGLQGVPHETVEAARSLGATPAQVLLQVKLPMARPSILAGLNQTMLFAISIATISALIGGTGLGQPVWSSLSRLEFGLALQPSIALILIAIIMDRTTQRLAARSEQRLTHIDDDTVESSPWRAFVRRNKLTLAVGAGALAFAIVAQSVPALLFANFSDPPAWMEIKLRGPVGDFVSWVTVNFGGFLGSVSDFIQLYMLNPISAVLAWMPWPAVLVGGAILGFAALRIRGAILVSTVVVVIGALGVWGPTIDTLAVVGVSAAVSIVIGFPVGVWMSQSQAVNAVLRPILDVLQTTPVFLFVIPAVVFIGSGPVAGTLATIFFALPAMVRYTNAGLREADPEIIEAARSAGTTNLQLLWQVRLPLSLKTIMVGVNQTILLALAMAVVSAFVGTPGLGRQVLEAVGWTDLSMATEAGFAMFLLAILVDRVLRGFTEKTEISERGRSRTRSPFRLKGRSW